MVEKIVNRIGKLCFGLAGIWAGEATGAVAVAEVAAGVFDRARAAGKDPERIFGRVIEKHRRAWAAEFARAPDREAIGAVEALLAGSLETVFDPDLLTAAAFDTRGMYQAAAKTIVARLGIGGAHSDTARRYAVGLVAAGLKAALDAGGLFDRFAKPLALEQARQTAAVLEAIDHRIRDEVPRELLENLAQRFGHTNPDAPVEVLSAFLKEMAKEWKALKARLAALEAVDSHLANSRAAAEDALARGDFDEADAILAAAEDIQQRERTLVEVRKQVELRWIRADAARLKGDADSASSHFEKAAEFLAPFDEIGSAAIRGFGADRLYEHAHRFGGTGLLRAIELYRRNLAAYTPKEHHPEAWAGTQNNLGNTLQVQAARTPGAAGACLLGEAVTAYRAALEVRTPSAHPFDWARIQNNLGGALHDQAMQSGGAARDKLLAEALAAYRAALKIYTRAAPLLCAETKRNLAGVLADQARSPGAVEEKLFGQAVVAYREALEVFSRVEHPAARAATQHELGRALVAQAKRTFSAAVAGRLLGEAETAYCEALELFELTEHPVQWAGTQNDLGIALCAQAARIEGTAKAGLLGRAIAAFQAALKVRTRTGPPVALAEAYDNLGLAFEETGDLNDGDAAARYREALGCFDAALEVFDPESMRPNRARCTANRERVAGKLAGPGDS